MSIEFDGVLKDGKIEVPAELATHLSGPVHVVVTASQRGANQPSMIEQLLDRPLVLEGFQPMKRDDANAR